VFIHMEVPFASRLEANNRTVFAVIGTMCSDDADLFVDPVILGVFAQRFADLFTSALFAFFSRADVEYFPGCMLFLAHDRTSSESAVTAVSNLLLSECEVEYIIFMPYPPRRLRQS
jgi:hypothetical protein